LEKRGGEFAELKQKAYEFLADKSLPPATNSLELVFQLLLEPTFHNHVSWTIFSEKSGSTRLARQVTWDRAFDGRRFFNPLEGLKHGWHTWPTINTQLASLDPLLLDVLLEEGHKCIAWVEDYRGIVVDGLHCSLYMAGYFEDRVVKWNYKPDEGNEFISWAEKMQDLLMNVFSTKLE
jgi:hypothetical protein